MNSDTNKMKIKMWRLKIPMNSGNISYHIERNGDVNNDFNTDDGNNGNGDDISACNNNITSIISSNNSNNS